jgi:hypothetical protein
MNLRSLSLVDSKSRVAYLLKNTSAAPLLRVSWAHPGQIGKDRQTALLPLVQNDTDMRQYYCCFDTEEAGVGVVRHFQISLEPAQITVGEVPIGGVRFITLAQRVRAD